jgi:hypothetical protein
MMNLVTLIILLVSFKAYSYTQFIGHGYTSCLNCHFSPSGGGALNDYGRVVSATLISSGGLYPKTWSQEKVADSSGLFFSRPSQNWLRAQFNYRGFRVVQNPGSSTTEQVKWINMQSDARVILKFGENDRFVAVGNYGYAPLPQSADPEEPKYRSREHYMGFRFTPKFGLYAGLMDKSFGIKVIEHIAFSRQSPEVAQNDQTHGVLAHYLGEQWEVFLHGFAGNLTQDKDVQAKGGSMMVEKTIFDLHRVGASFMSTKNLYQELTSYSVHGRFNLKEGSSVLAEFGQTTRKTDN